MPLFILKAVDAIARVFGRELVFVQTPIFTGEVDGWATYAKGRITYSLDPVER